MIHLDFLKACIFEVENRSFDILRLSARALDANLSEAF